MAMVKTVESYLNERGVDYVLVLHPHTGSSMETAEVAHVPGDSLAKGVVLKDGEEFLLVVIPSDYHLNLDLISSLLKRELHMADENILGTLFPDCEVGAIPAIGQAYAIRTIWDPSSSLGRVDEVFFEAGDHKELVCVSGETFHELMASADRMSISQHI